MTTPITRDERFVELFPDAPKFRLKQMHQALFTMGYRSWNDVVVFSPTMRNVLAKEMPWSSVEEIVVRTSKRKDTYKALVKVEGGKEVETVLMKNTRGWWTICVSSQIGCAMKCGFCATGKMGITRSLTSDEIVDQVRFWREFLEDRPELPERITNVVFMGMGEPLANYVNVRTTLNEILAMTEIGPTHITVSTVGVLPRLQKILEDPEWPHIRLAISLHSAIAETRKEIVPTSFDGFLSALTEWSVAYLEKFGNRRHHLTFEYVMLSGVNDSLAHADALARIIKKIGNVRVNLIPYNFTGGEFSSTTSEGFDIFMDTLEFQGITVTKRKTMGEDIAAACGQLKTEEDQAAN